MAHNQSKVTDYDTNRLTHEAIADVDAGNVIDHQLVLAWAEGLWGYFLYKFSKVFNIFIRLS